jgi:hypothetical protein
VCSVFSRWRGAVHQRDSSFPSFRRITSQCPRAAPAWVTPLVDVFAAARAEIDSAVEHAGRMESDDVLRSITSGLSALGFAIELGKTKAKKLPRPVFFGDEGTFLRTYEIDAFEPQNGIALEVEAGRATMGNAVYRHLIQASLMVDARFLALAVPVEYRYRSGTAHRGGEELREDVHARGGDLRDPAPPTAVRGRAPDRILSPHGQPFARPARTARTRSCCVSFNLGDRARSSSTSFCAET